MVTAALYSQEIFHVPHLSRRTNASTVAHHYTLVRLQLICRLALRLPDFNFGSTFDSPSGDALDMQFSLTGELPIRARFIQKQVCMSKEDIGDIGIRTLNIGVLEMIWSHGAQKHQSNLQASTSCGKEGIYYTINASGFQMRWYTEHDCFTWYLG